MKNLALTILFLTMLLEIHAQSDRSAIVIISSTSTPEYIKEMKKDLKKMGLVLNVDKEIWASQEELQEFGFSITNKKTKGVKSFFFKYNELNKHQIFLMYPIGDGKYGEVMSDVSYMKNDLIPMLITKKIRRAKPTLFRTYASSGDPYLQFTVLKDLEMIESSLEETVELHKRIKVDQTTGKSLSQLTYTYNGVLLEDPSGINLQDMTSDVLIEDLEEDYKIVNIWSDAPLNEIIMGATIAGQR